MEASNKLIINDIIKNCCIRVNGVNNHITLCGELHNVSITIEGNNNIIDVGDGSILLGGEIAILDDNNSIIVGEKVGIQKNMRLISLEGKTIRIGNNCSISYDVELRTSDAHSIFELKNNEYVRTNRAEDIIIGDNCWIGQQVLVLKGAVIGTNSVVGAKSLVQKLSTSDNCLLVGTPAKVIKTNIKWQVERLV